jgi:hypothetical protein
VVYRWLGVVPKILVVVALALLVPSGALASGGTLSGTWNGTLEHAMKADKLQRVHLTVVINASERGGSWYAGSSCHGTLTLEGISWGFHHYTEHLAAGSTCIGGAVDCLKRVGANIYDTVTPPSTVSYNANSTLHRLRT